MAAAWSSGASDRGGRRDWDWADMEGATHALGPPTPGPDPCAGDRPLRTLPGRLLPAPKLPTALSPAGTRCLSSVCLCLCRQHVTEPPYVTILARRPLRPGSPPPLHCAAAESVAARVARSPGLPCCVLWSGRGEQRHMIPSLMIPVAGRAPRACHCAQTSRTCVESA
jgi:hypothetical protein